MGLGFFLWTLSTLAFETVRILEATSTGRALILDRGIFEGIRENDFALFYKKKFRPGHFPSYHPILKAEAIKVGDKSSFWLAHESTLPGVLRKDGHLSMIRLSRHKQKHLQVHQYQIITPSSQLIDIDKKDQTYAFEKISPPIKNNEKKDIKITHTANWQKPTDGEKNQFSFQQTFPTINKKSISKSFETEHFSQIATKAINKLNDSKNIDEYLSILKSPPSHYLAGREPRWSRYMNEHQLQNFFVKSGVVEEVFQRQKMAVQEWKGSEIHIRYATGFHIPLIGHDDTFNTKLALSAGYEYHLANINSLWKKWTLELEAENRNTNLNIEGYRFSSQEFLFKAWCYFYFHNTALSIEQYLAYLGLGIQQGAASLSSSSLRNNYEYHISSFPSLRVGAKYKFAKDKLLFSKLSFGANLLLTIAPLRYNNLTRGRQFKGSNIQKVSSTISIGLSIYL